jgi:membrane protein implicated in regulation of membrane protease activity
VLTVAYIALAALGCGYVLLSGFLGHVGDAGGGGHVAGGDAHSHYGVDGSGHGAVHAGEPGAAAFHFPLFSPLALATFIGALGAFGLIARLGVGLGDWQSLVVAVPAAALTAYLASYAGWRIFAGASASSAIRMEDIPGARGEVLTPIPAGGMGEVAVLVDGQRFTSAAREVEGREVPRGTNVTVVRMVGSTLLVRAESRKA